MCSTPVSNNSAQNDLRQVFQRTNFADLEYTFMESHDFRRRYPENRRRPLRSFPRLPAPIQPLEDGHLRYELEQCISDGGFRQLNESIGRSIAQKNNIDMSPAKDPTEHEETTPPQQSDPTSFGSIIRHYLSPHVFASPPDTTAPPPKRLASQWNAVDLILGREAGLGRTNHWTLPQKRGALCPSQIPASASRVVDRKQGSHAYTGTFSDDGKLFVAGFQDQRILVYEPEFNWVVRKDITARMLRWTITDTCLSHDNGYLLYSTILPIVHIVKLHGEDSIVDSQANITEIHAPIYIGEEDSEMFGIWSMAWSKDCQEIVVGTNGEEGNIKLYNMQQQYTTASVPGHVLDVNAVAFMDDTSQVFVSGSDDADIKLWDRRILGQDTAPAGVLVGHLEGITHIDTKGDGRYLISNSKDQTIKLWDVRKMVSEAVADDHRQTRNSTMPHLDWDYRWNDYPASEYLLKHPCDASLMTFRGHRVLQTLIRAYFSPSFTTGQRYIYSGCRNGTIRIFDILTGETVQTLSCHKTVVRDCSWHPYEPLLISTAWDGHLVEWIPARSE